MHCGHWDKRRDTGSIGVAVAAADDNTDVADMDVVGVGV